MTKYQKYSREYLEPIVLDSLSISEIMRKIGVRQSGGNHSYIKRRISDLGIPTNHLLGQGASIGSRKKGGMWKTPAKDILVLRPSGKREAPHRLRRSLIEMGVEYKCSVESCGITGIWKGKEIRLEVDHINGNWLDNRIENLRFLCPNCHSQTTIGLSEIDTQAKSLRERRRKKRALGETEAAEVLDTSV